MKLGSHAAATPHPDLIFWLLLLLREWVFPSSSPPGMRRKCCEQLHVAGRPHLSSEDCSPYQGPSAASPVGEHFKDSEIRDLEKCYAPDGAANLLRGGPGCGDVPQGCPGQAAGGESRRSLSFGGTGPAGEQRQEEEVPLQPPLWLHPWLEGKRPRKNRKDAQPLPGPGGTWWFGRYLYPGSRSKHSACC